MALSQLPPPGQCLAHQHVTPIALVPMESSTRDLVHEELKAAAKRTGIPRVIVDDHGGDLHGGVQQFQKQHSRTLEFYDLKHKAACLLKRRLEGEEAWAGFQRQVGQTRCAIQQTELAFLTPPGPRPKSRFMNLRPLLEWGRKTAAVLLDPPQGFAQGAGRERLEEKLGWLREFEGCLRRWAQWQEVVEVAVEQVDRQGLYAGAAAELQEKLKPVLARWPQEASSRSLAEELVAFVGEETSRVPEGRRYPGSTEVVESVLGKFKAVEKQQAKGGFTGLVLAMGALVSEAASGTVQSMMELVEQALAGSLTRDVVAWWREHLGPTLGSLRRRAFATALGAQQNLPEPAG